MRDTYPSESEIHSAFNAYSLKPQDFEIIDQLIEFIKEAKFLGVTTEKLKVIKNKLLESFKHHLHILGTFSKNGNY